MFLLSFSYCGSPPLSHMRLLLQFFSNVSHTPGVSSSASFTKEVQCLMCVVLAFSAAGLMLHSFIDK